jgi:hypothetical protein
MTKSFGGFRVYRVLGDYGLHEIWGLWFIME